MTLQTYNWLMIYILGFFCSVLLTSIDARNEGTPMSTWTSAEWITVFFYGGLSFLCIAMVCLAYLFVWVSEKGKKPLQVLHQFLTKERRFFPKNNTEVMFEDERSEGVNCGNKECSFFDPTGTFEQNCSKGDNYDNSLLPECEDYIPEEAISEVK